MVFIMFLRKLSCKCQQSVTHPYKHIQTIFHKLHAHKQKRYTVQYICVKIQIHKLSCKPHVHMALPFQQTSQTDSCRHTKNYTIKRNNLTCSISVFIKGNTHSKWSHNVLFFNRKAHTHHTSQTHTHLCPHIQISSS